MSPADVINFYDYLFDDQSQYARRQKNALFKYRVLLIQIKNSPPCDDLQYAGEFIDEVLALAESQLIEVPDHVSFRNDLITLLNLV